MTIIEDSSPQTTEAVISNKLDTNSLIELETQIQRKKDDVFKRIQNKCDSNERRGRNADMERKPQVAALTEAVGPTCFYQDKLSTLRQKIASIQNRQNAVNHSMHASFRVNQLNSTLNATANHSHISNLSKVHFDPGNFPAMDPLSSYGETQNKSRNPIQTFQSHQSHFMSHALSVTSAGRDLEDVQPPNIRDKVQNLKERLHAPTKPPLKETPCFTQQKPKPQRRRRNQSQVHKLSHLMSKTEPSMDVTSPKSKRDKTSMHKTMSSKQINLEVPLRQSSKRSKSETERKKLESKNKD
jgi:hypothetical protein